MPCDCSLVSNVWVTGVFESIDFPHGVFAASAASVVCDAFIYAHDGLSVTGNTSSVVDLSGSGSTRTYCVCEAPDLEEGCVTSV